MEHHCEHEVAVSLLFTMPTGEVFEVSRADFTAAFPLTPVTDDEQPTTTPVIEAVSLSLPIRTHVNHLDGSEDTQPAPVTTLPDLTAFTSSLYNPSCSSSSPLIEIVTPEELLLKRAAYSLDDQTSKSVDESPYASGQRNASFVRANILKVSMVYNEYGELVNARDAHRQPDPSELGVTQLLRLIKKAYRHKLREKLGDIIVQLQDERGNFLAARDGSRFVKERLSLCVLRQLSKPTTPEKNTSLAVDKSPARVLDIGCGDGNWCFKVKLVQPDWIVEGVDDSDHWLCMNSDILTKDSLESVQHNQEAGDTNFSQDHAIQAGPDFIVRNINNLLAHPRPMSRNLYEIARGRDIFDRIESYKSFLDDVRSILQPDGVVEFVEIDPRPRAIFVLAANQRGDHKSRPYTDWTDKITDRFKDWREQELATTVPCWSARVEERLKANLRPRDGVAAPQLKSWLEGAGFWDVSQTVAQIPVGGNTLSGQLLKGFLLYLIELENEIPKLRQELPEVDLSELEHGNFYLNLHIVTGRKPKDPRPGDLLSNGTRQEMTNFSYDTMARFRDEKSSQW